MSVLTNTPVLALRLCTERLFDGSFYHGYACCKPEDHDGPHAITCGTTTPPFSTVVRKWESEGDPHG